MKLTAKAVVAAQFRDKAEKHFDGHGLYLHATKTARTWRYTYRIAGKAREFTIGSAALLSLAEARDRHRDARKIVLAGSDPVTVRRDEKSAIETAVRRAEVAAYTVAHCTAQRRLVG